MKKLLCICLSLMLILCGCGGSTEETTAPTETTAATEPPTETTQETTEPPIAEFSLGEFTFKLIEGIEIADQTDDSYILSLVPDKSWAIVYAIDVSKLDALAIDSFVYLQHKTLADPDTAHSNEYTTDSVVPGFDSAFEFYTTVSDSGNIRYHLATTFTDTWYAYTFYFVSLEDSNEASYPFGALIGSAVHSGKEPRFELNSTDETVSSETSGSSDSLGTTDNPYGSGMYKVGTDLPAGEYLFIANGSRAAYVCVSSDSNQDDIIENENFTYSYFLTVSDGQYLEASRCSFLIAEKYTVNINDDGTFSDGMYRVGIDIPAGEYKLTSTEHGYYCIYNNSVAPLDIVDNDNFENNSYVTVSDGQYLLITRCNAEPVQ